MSDERVPHTRRGIDQRRRDDANQRWLDARRPIEPTVTRAPRPGGEDTVETHPAYGMIAASRVSGAAYLADSDFKHQHYMTIEVMIGERHRDLHHDWWFPRATLLRLAMSEAQWATFVSSPNAGSGVPCTLEFVADRGPRPSLPAPRNRVDQFSGEMADKLAGVRARVKRLQEMVESGAGKKALRDELHQLAMELGTNLDFIAKQFGEHVEETVERAKIDVHAYMSQAIAAAGLQALEAQAPLAVEPPSDTKAGSWPR